MSTRHELLLPRDALLLHVREGALELRRRASSLADLLALCFLGAYAVLTRPRVPRTTAVLLGFFAAFVARLPDRLLQPRDARRRSRSSQGDGQVPDPLRSSSRSRWRGSGGAARATTGARSAGSAAASRSTRPTASSSCSSRAGRRQPRLALVSPLTGGASQINIYGAVEGVEGVPAERAHRRPEPPRDHADRAAARADAALPAARAPATACGGGSALLIAFLLVVELATLSRSGLLGLGVGAIVLALPVPALPALARAARAARRRARRARRSSCSRGWHFFVVVFRSRMQTGGGSQSAHFQVYTSSRRSCTATRCSASA